MRSKTLDKFANTKYNIDTIKQNLAGVIFMPVRFANAKLVESRGREEAMGKKKRKSSKEKELLEQKRIKFQIYESVTAIIATIVTMILAIITAVLNWID